jgi:hypothetical protein
MTLARAVCFPLCPGAVDTDMLNRSIEATGIELPPTFPKKSVEETAGHILARIDEATRETDVFLQWNKASWPW